MLIEVLHPYTAHVFAQLKTAAIVLKDAGITLASSPPTSTSQPELSSSAPKQIKAAAVKSSVVPTAKTEVAKPIETPARKCLHRRSTSLRKRAEGAYAKYLEAVSKRNNIPSVREKRAITYLPNGTLFSLY